MNQAYVAMTEEQQRLMLHCHAIVWVYGYTDYESLRDLLDKTPGVRVIYFTSEDPRGSPGCPGGSPEVEAASARIVTAGCGVVLVLDLHAATPPFHD